MIAPGAAVASCVSIPSTLEEDYEQAGGLVVAQAAGCPGMLLSENGSCPAHRRE